MKKTRRVGKSPTPVRARTSREGAAVPREAWTARLSWRALRVRAALVHAFASVRDGARVRASHLGRRASSARARLWWLARGTARFDARRLGRGNDSTSDLARPALAGALVAGLAFFVSGAPWPALAAGGWTFAIALLLALRAAQQRHALTVEREFDELRQQLRVTHRNGVAMRRELYDLVQQLRVSEPPVQDEELEAAEEADLNDEPTRAVPVPKPTGLGWRKRFGLHWPVSR